MILFSPATGSCCSHSWTEFILNHGDNKQPLGLDPYPVWQVGGGQIYNMLVIANRTLSPSDSPGRTGDRSKPRTTCKAAVKTSPARHDLYSQLHNDGLTDHKWISSLVLEKKCHSLYLPQMIIRKSLEHCLPGACPVVTGQYWWRYWWWLYVRLSGPVCSAATWHSTVASQTAVRADISPHWASFFPPSLTAITVGRKGGEKADNDCVYFQN